MGASETRRLGEFPLFDWLRFAMAAGVTLSHNKLIGWPSAGNLCVQVFFALSGWLIGTILIEMRENRLDLFYFNRATRVWLPYFAAMTVLYAVSAARDPITPRWFEFLVYDVTFTHNWFSLLPDAIQALRDMPLQGSGNHFWSLAVEEQFYLTAPLLILFTPFGRRPLFWIAAAAVAIAAGTNYGAISLGVAAAATHHRRPDLFARPDLRWAALAVAAVLAPVLAIDGLYRIVAPLFAIAVVLSLSVAGSRSALGRFAGGISYPVYLNGWVADFVAHGVLKHAGHDDVLVEGVLASLLAVAVGSVAYLAIDRPVLAHRKTWFTPRRGRWLAGIAYALVGIGAATGLTLKIL